jgi:hypothetical protein
MRNVSGAGEMLIYRHHMVLAQMVLEGFVLRCALEMLGSQFA